MAGCKIASLSYLENIPETTAAYIAGLIDADGTVTINSTFRRRSRLQSYPMAMVLIVNSDLGLIRWLKETIGFGCAYMTKTRPVRPDQNDAHWNAVHRYQITGRAAMALLAICRPYMRVKSRQADIVCGLAVRGVNFPGRATEEQRAHALAATKTIRILNQRGLKTAFQYELSVG